MRLSVVVIAKNEEAVIGRCLASVAWADERIVVDSGSTDRTIEICGELGARVVHADWRGPATQRNRGIEQAAGDWILALDADEWVTDALRSEIEQTIRSPGAASVYRLPRLSSYCGRFMRHSGWWPDYISRLFRRGAAKFGGGIVHDHLLTDEPIGRLRTPLMHEPFRSLDKVLEKMNAYSTWGAERLHEDGKRSGLLRAIFHGWWAFVRTYFVRAGFLDGREGFMLAVSNAEGTYYKYVKLMLLARRDDET
ncbi:MAG TPA: glycosyltransferase family 2 protein [Burkholderiales bacterium]|nr:glycosyltransferase family 2 protein [Burkholderiales bacterium]